MKRGLIVFSACVLIGLYGLVSVPQQVGASYISSAWMDAILTMNTNVGTSATGVDSLVVLVSEPEQRTLSDAQALFQLFDLSTVASKTMPIVGVDVNGARGAIVTLTFTTFTGAFNVYDVFTAAQSDTFATCYSDTSIVFSNIAATELYATTGATEKITYFLTPPNGSDFLLGYYHVRIVGLSTTAVADLTGSIKVLW